MKESGSQPNEMEQENTFGPMGPIMKENGLRTKLKAKVD